MNQMEVIFVQYVGKLQWFPGNIQWSFTQKLHKSGCRYHEAKHSTVIPIVIIYVNTPLKNNHIVFFKDIVILKMGIGCILLTVLS